MMTKEDRAALREAAQAVIDTQGHDPECHAYMRIMSGTHPAAVLALLDAADERDRLNVENARLREALRKIARLAELVAHDLQGRVEGGKVSAVYRIARDARIALEPGA